jgi:DNA mismatch repair protein MutS
VNESLPKDQGAPADPISLLWPTADGQGPSAPQVDLEADCARDLGLGDLITTLSPDPADRRAIESVLLRPPRDPAVIRYRQDILADLLAAPELAARMAGLMPALKSLGRSHVRAGRERSTLHQVVARLGELENFVNCVGVLHDALDEAAARPRAASAAQSAGWQALRQAVNRTFAEPTYQHLIRELPSLLEQVRTSASITVGVNLDHNLQPVEATLLSINDKKFRGSTWLGKLFGGDANQWEGIAPLHAVPEQAGGAANVAAAGLSPMMVPLFRDLASVLERAAQPVAQALQQFGTFNTGLLDRLGQELPFYLGAVQLITEIRSHALPMCRPEIVPEADRVTEVQDGYNLNLALQLATQAPQADLSQTVVTNAISFGPAGRVIVLTGPNQGGKTTYLQGIGLIQVLAQAGLYVPGQAARISLVDGIYTHFPTEEKLAQGTGRFGDEARRLHDIFAHVTRYSLVLLNESLSGTSAGESLYLGQDIVRVLRALGVRAIFATHLHELAAGIDQLNAAEPGDSPIVSMVAAPLTGAIGNGQQAEEGSRRYKIIFGPPLGRSYAREIAERYGVSYEQLRELLARRGAF